MKNKIEIVTISLFVIMAFLFFFSLQGKQKEIIKLEQTLKENKIKEEKLDLYINTRKNLKISEENIKKGLIKTSEDILIIEKKIRCQRAFLGKIEKGDCEKKEIYEKFTLNNFSN